MKFEITEKNENQLLGRIEITAKIEAEGGTPSNQAILDRVVAELSAKKELVAISQIASTHGTSQCIARIKIYKNPEVMAKVETTSKKEEAKKEGGEEAPTEEKKEEKGDEA